MRSEFAEDAAAFMPFHIATRSGGPLDGLTVLVVEDSKLSSETLRLLCISSGARVRRANGITTTMRHLRAYRPDIIITEMHLPDGDGASLIANLSDMKPRPSVILGMSAQQDGRADAIRAGADGFISKPVESIAIFQHAIRSALPPGLQQWKPSPVPDKQIVLDDLMLTQDLAHGLAMLTSSRGDQAIGYTIAFITGVAAVAKDIELFNCAKALSAKIESGAPDLNDIEQIQAMLTQRLHQDGFAPVQSSRAASGGRLQ